MLKYEILIGLGMATCLALVPWIGRLAIHLGAVDLPGQRRVHVASTPRFGGLAIYVALALSLLIMSGSDSFVFATLWNNYWQVLALICGATIVTVLGLVDDWRGIRPGIKLGVEAAVATAAAAAGYRITSILGIDLGWLWAPTSILWIVAVMNAVNLVDGLDGLASGVGLLICTSLFSISVLLGEVRTALILAALSGTLAAFLWYNFYPARIFLGDSGSLLIGYLLALLAVESSIKTMATVAFLVPLLALGLPLAELVLTVLRRLLDVIHVVHLDAQSDRYKFLFLGQPALFTADRQHIHHRLLSLGIDYRKAVLLLYAACALGCGAAFLMAMNRQANAALVLILFGVVAVVCVRHLHYEELSLLRRGLLLPLFDLPVANRRIAYVLVDLGFVVASYLAAILIESRGAMTSELRQAVLATLPLVALTQMGCMAWRGLYGRSYRYAGVGDLLALLKTLASACIASGMATLVVWPGRGASLAVLIMDAYFLASLVIGSRLAFRLFEHMFKEGRQTGHNILIYGAGNGGVAALREIERNVALDMRAVGFLDDDPAKCSKTLDGLPIYRGDQLDGLIARHCFEVLVVGTEKIDTERLWALAGRCALAGITLRRFSMTWDKVEFGADPEVPARHVVG